MFQKRFFRMLTFPRTLAFAAALAFLSTLVTPSARADAYIADCCNIFHECDTALCSDGGWRDWFRGIDYGACGTTAKPPGGSGTCKYSKI